VTTLGEILDSIEDALELERELGVAAMECDRTVLLAAPRRPAPQPPQEQAREEKSGARMAFLHDRPFSPHAAELFAKILAAMGQTPESAPLATMPPVPPAKAQVVLGGLALRKFYPSAKAAPGQWFKSPRGEDVLVTYSPEYILRFGQDGPAVRKMKGEMWNSLKTLIRRTQDEK